MSIKVLEELQHPHTVLPLLYNSISPGFSLYFNSSLYNEVIFFSGYPPLGSDDLLLMLSLPAAEGCSPSLSQTAGETAITDLFKNTPGMEAPFCSPPSQHCSFTMADRRQ